MTSNPEQIKADIEATRAGLSRDVDALAQAVRPANVVARQRDKVTTAVFGAKDAVMGQADHAQTASGELLQSTGKGMSSAPQAAMKRAQGNPLAAGMIALGIGWLAGSIMPATRAERLAADALKEQASPLVEEAADLARESARNLQEPAKEAVAAVSDTGAEAVQTVKEVGSATAADVADAAKQAMA